MRQRAVSTDKINAFQVLVLMFCFFFSSMQSNFVGFIACSNEVRIKYGPGSKNPSRSGIFFLIEINVHGRYH